MTGRVDDAGRALLTLSVRSSAGALAQELEVWIDTAFNGDLVAPQSVIDGLKLPQSAAVLAVLADGNKVELETHRCHVDWFGATRVVEVVANDGKHPLLGVGLLMDRKLTIDYRKLTVKLA